MSQDHPNAEQVETLLATPALADALDSEQFRRFLDGVPIAIIVSEMKAGERIVYADPEFEKVSGRTLSGLVGKPWSVLTGIAESKIGTHKLGAAIANSSDFVGTFKIERPGHEPALVDAYSNVIEDDDGEPSFRLAALVDLNARGQEHREELEKQLRDKDVQLLEIQHRVKTICR